MSERTPYLISRIRKVLDPYAAISEADVALASECLDELEDRLGGEREALVQEVGSLVMRAVRHEVSANEAAREILAALTGGTDGE